jgi:hypothetical protein
MRLGTGIPWVFNNVMGRHRVYSRTVMQGVYGPYLHPVFSLKVLPSPAWWSGFGYRTVCSGAERPVVENNVLRSGGCSVVGPDRPVGWLPGPRAARVPTVAETPNEMTMAPTPAVNATTGSGASYSALSGESMLTSRWSAVARRQGSDGAEDEV